MIQGRTWNNFQWKYSKGYLCHDCFFTGHSKRLHKVCMKVCYEQVCVVLMQSKGMKWCYMLYAVLCNTKLSLGGIFFSISLSLSKYLRYCSKWFFSAPKVSKVEIKWKFPPVKIYCYTVWDNCICRVMDLEQLKGQRSMLV